MSKKIKLKISSRLLKKRSRKATFGAKHCRFCASSEQLGFLDFKNATYLRSFITERGKILPSRISGNCSSHQRELSAKIKKARIMALLPYSAALV